jgi:peptidylprolyl isomerase domain and WD repeat-containing protein 1
MSRDDLRRRTEQRLSDAVLSRLPSSEMYHRPYMHADHVQFVASSRRHDFFATLSGDGAVKFWHRVEGDLEFVKGITAQDGAFHSCSVSPDGDLLATGSRNGRVSVFDICSFSLASKFDFRTPLRVTLCFVGAGPIGRLAVAFSGDPAVRIVDALEQPPGDAAPATLRLLSGIHRSPTSCMQFIDEWRAVVSCDCDGLLEFWRPDGREPPFAYTLKTDTDLYLMAQASLAAVSVAASRTHIAVCCSDWAVRVFDIASGRLVRMIPDDLGRDDCFGIDADEFAARAAAEREYRRANSYFAVAFDETGETLVVPSIVGIKFIALTSGALVRVIGRVEKNERFNSVALLQAGGVPMAAATAFERQRFYLFTNRAPESAKRDVFNERAAKERLVQTIKPRKAGTAAWPAVATLHTTMGSIKFRMFPGECPLAVENFVTHARRGYYDNIRIHRVVRDFCIQTGDPTWSGTGGQSTWGGTFEDEFPDGGNRFDRPGMVGMANTGKNSNGSQFFITTVAVDSLSGKHTCWGEVVDGMDNVKAIELVPVDNYRHPLQEIKLVNITFG